MNNRRRTLNKMLCDNKGPKIIKVGGDFSWIPFFLFKLANCPIIFSNKMTVNPEPCCLLIASQHVNRIENIIKILVAVN